ncbi:hypothetical protein CORC01_12513 [Colletotrichum orchidophilum]|uniref:Uncharacterized protein n=1 Tax=Colletotrichum orchidophilum TaxID=1209926 RepID=A0A1G4ASM5_9PEZI|nr:uncharacterized protein CORC01_12513 [Colletotrichum orchidophilum]OHE92168.1 hypothetical protein CORC01_12513 [Colletotrichum orchidophilum]
MADTEPELERSPNPPFLPLSLASNCMKLADLNCVPRESDAENECLRAELGWVKKENAGTREYILKVVEIVANAAILTTGGEVEASHKRIIRNLHTGFSIVSHSQ